MAAVESAKIDCMGTANAYATSGGYMVAVGSGFLAGSYGSTQTSGGHPVIKALQAGFQAAGSTFTLLGVSYLSYSSRTAAGCGAP
jgi:hypothetical protein